MHFAFIDIASSYTAARPDEDKPFGGTNSAVCFLARELVKAGVPCTLFNKVEKPAEAHGIQSLPLEALVDERNNPAYSVFVFCSRWADWLVELVREKTRAPLIAWVQESTLTPPFMAPLAAFDGIAFVSEWQKCINQPLVQPHWRQAVMRNAMNPRFAQLFPPGTPILAAKTKTPVLIYSGATPRGVLHMPNVLEHLSRKRRDFSVEICCRVSPSRDAEINEAYASRMRCLPNVTHVGMVGQADLAARMQRGAILVAPNPWPETSCITLMEAMAAGLLVVTTNRAVLPETASGFARHIAIEDADHPLRFDMPMPYEAFAEIIDRMMDNWLKKPAETELQLRKQIDYFLENYQWPKRVKPWIGFVSEFKESQRLVG